jgi:hypothetical protein
MLSKLTNQNAIQQCEQNTLEAEQRLDLLKNEMQKLQLKRFAETGIPVSELYQSHILTTNIKQETLIIPTLPVGRTILPRSNSNGILGSMLDILGIKSRANSESSFNGDKNDLSLSGRRSKTNISSTDFGIE